MNRIVTACALAAGLLVASALPISYWTIARASVERALSAQAEISAHALNGLIALAPGPKALESTRLEAVLERPAHGDDITIWRVVPAEGAPVASSAGTLPSPVITRSAPILDDGRIAGRVEIARSLRSEIIDTAALGLLGLLLSGVTVGTLLALRRTLGQLRRETALNRRLESENRALEAACTAKSKLLVNISHQMRTQMYGLLGTTDLLLATPVADGHRRHLLAMRHCGETLLGASRDILDLYRVEVGRLKLDPMDVDLPDLVDDVLRTVAARVHDKGLEITARIGAEVPGEVRLDPTRLRQLLLNLLDNAVKSTQRGEIIVTVEAADTCALEGTAAECLLRFSVTDTGVGLDARMQADLLGHRVEISSASTRRHGSLGLGLAITKRLAELMGGSMGATGERGRGSSFWVTVRAKVPSQSKRETTDARLQGARILVVEDNATHREVLSAHVMSTGASCDAAVDGLTGLESIHAANAAAQPYKVALIDTTMPRMDGLSLVRAVRADPCCAGLRLVMLAPLSDTQAIAEARAAGADLVLNKPIRHIELRNALGKLLEASPAGPQTDLDADRADFRGARVLLAEGDPATRERVRAMLEKADCQVTSAGDGRAVVERWLEEPFALVLMDCRLPELDGFEATRGIRALEGTTRARTPIIALSASAPDGDRERCLAAGMDDYLRKPFEHDTLAELLGKWLRRAEPANSGRLAEPAPQRCAA